MTLFDLIDKHPTMVVFVVLIICVCIVFTASELRGK